MKRTISLLWIGVLLAGLVGCVTANDQKADPGQSQALQTVVGTPANTVVPQSPTIPTSLLGAQPSGSMNQFPADFGGAALRNGKERPVPQARGMDHRPTELVLPSHEVEVPAGDESAKTQTAFATLPSGTLVLYDSTGPYGWLGELYGIAAINLASHFGATASKPVIQYKVGDIAKYKAVIYIGSTYDEPLPVAFLDDVLASSVPVVWMYDNIWQLANRAADFFGMYGYNPWAFDVTSISQVTYHGTVLTRDSTNGAGIMQFSPFDDTRVATLATATRADGTTLPWAIRSGNLTYVGEVPFAFIDHNDRYLVFCDLLFDVLAPTTATQHRALVRLEDVSPMTDPTAFKAMVDYLYANGVPFSVATIALYTDPLGAANAGKAQTAKWTQKTAMLTQLKYAVSHGGTLVLHGYTHQYGSLKNPYSGTTADDFEFYMAHVDTVTDNVVYDGAVPQDTAAWAMARITSAQSALKAAGLTSPTIFEYPHYAGSPTDSKAIKALIGTAYHRGLYFSGDLGLTKSDITHSIGLFYPYAVTDVYGWKIKPENMGNYEPSAYNNHPPRLSADLVTTAQNNLVIRDGVASFFFHPYEPLAELQAIVTGVKAAGYKFVAVNSL